jgi:hypothetical protein
MSSDEERNYGLIRGSSRSVERALEEGRYGDIVFVREDTSKRPTEDELYAEFLQAQAKYNDLMGWND